ncbi:hypothetical protein ABEB36_001431 [Hypothenemus hampei]|uniref:Sensory neuron membrane protein 2 n=1 Tax=Hypothenemus hampei TaxID=57062 RepID=A0ABD1FEI4_HYPHA
MKVPRIKVNLHVVFFCGLFGILLLLAGFLIGFNLLPYYVNNKILDTKVLKENTEQWNVFVKVPFSFEFKVFLFVVKNPEEVLQGAKPVVKERGPYVYRLSRWKDQISWNYTTDEISYYEYEKYEFDQVASGNLTEDDNVLVLNAPYLSFLYTAESNEETSSFLPMIEEALPFIFADNNSPFLTNVTVKQFLFDGVKLCPNGCTEDGFVASMVCSKIKEKLKTTKQMRMQGNDILYATFYYRNMSHQEYFTVNSGRRDKQAIGEVTQLDGAKYLKSWTSQNCNRVQGLTSVFPTKCSPETKFQSFSADICRTVKFEFSRSENMGKIKTYRYKALNSSFNSTNENSCYCTQKTLNFHGQSGCLYDGILDLSTCQGAPVMVSFPHLLHTDLRYGQSVTGLQPNETIHEMFVNLEPITGTPLKLAKRVQFNLFLRPVNNITVLQNAPEALVPLFWIEETVTLPLKYQDFLERELHRSLLIVNAIRYSIIGVALAIICCCIFIFLWL